MSVAEQGAIGFRMWTEHPAPESVMRAALEKAFGAAVPAASSSSVSLPEGATITKRWRPRTGTVRKLAGEDARAPTR